MKKNRNELANEFIELYGKGLSEQQLTALKKLGKGIIPEELNRDEVIKHKKRMTSLIKMFKQ